MTESVEVTCEALKLKKENGKFKMIRSLGKDEPRCTPCPEAKIRRKILAGSS